jgi:RNA polymerase sigma factor (sigma-70 family)
VLVNGKALNGVVQRIRAIAAVKTGRACGDRELLERFLKAADEAAFAVLVDRHAPMILGLCRRLLRDRHDADDACQATFLVLARAARSVRKQESLASWLHGVAYRISMSLKRQEARRLRREHAVRKPAVCAADDDLSWRECRAVLDEELARLPERYRAPLILCYLEGKTRDEAAQELHVKPGRLHGLLDRGRKLLRERLIRRGLTLSTVLFAAALTRAAGRAALAPAVVVKSTRAALALLRGETVAAGLVAPPVLSLVKEASQAMFMTKLKIGAALVAAAVIWTGILGGSLSSAGLAQDSPGVETKATTAAPRAESDAEFIRRMSKELRGMDPSATEVHFFVSNKDANRRQKLIDLFIQERQAKEVQDKKKADTVALQQTHTAYLALVAQNRAQRRLAMLQAELLTDLGKATKDKKEVAAITQKYLDQLQEYVKAHPKNEDVPDAMQQIALIYRSQGKTVEADAWREKLLKEHPKSPAAKAAQKTTMATPQLDNILRTPYLNTPTLNMTPYLNTPALNMTPYLNTPGINMSPYLNTPGINNNMPLHFGTVPLNTLSPYWIPGTYQLTPGQRLNPSVPHNEEKKEKQK